MPPHHGTITLYFAVGSNNYLPLRGGSAGLPDADRPGRLPHGVAITCQAIGDKSFRRLRGSRADQAIALRREELTE